MMVHWILNNNTCFLTLLEKFIRNKNGISINNEDCFTCRLIEPVYDFKKNYNKLSNIIYLGTTSLWILSFFKLYNKYKSGEIKNIYDFYKI